MPRRSERLRREHLDLDAELGERLGALRRTRPGPSTLAGSLTRSRASVTPSTTARAEAKARLAAFGSAQWITIFFSARSFAFCGALLLGRLGFVFLEIVAAQHRAQRKARDIGRRDTAACRLEVDMRVGASLPLRSPRTMPPRLSQSSGW